MEAKPLVRAKVRVTTEGAVQSYPVLEDTPRTWLKRAASSFATSSCREGLEDMVFRCLAE